MGNTDCTLGEEETKEILILIKNMQSGPSETLKAYVLFMVCPIDAGFAFNSQENFFYYPISFYFISSEDL